MKRRMLLAVLAAIAGTAHAQWWVAGSVNLSNDTADGIDHAQDYNSSSTIDFSPTLGYDLNDRWAVGASFNYAHLQNSYSHNQILDAKTSSCANKFRLSPFVRYYATEGRLRLFVDGEAGYSFWHTKGADDSNHTVHLGIEPGLSFTINDKVGLVTRIGGVDWGHGWAKNGSSDTFELSLTGNVAIGFYVKL